MNCLRIFTITALLIMLCGQFGCQPQQPLFLTERGRWQNHYISKATKIEYPDTDVCSLPEVSQAAPPLTLSNPDPTAMWDLTLEESVQMALKNSKVIRTLNGVGFSKAGASGAPGSLLQAPGGVSTVYDPALIESNPNYGIEAALSAFDGTLNATSTWNKTDDPAWNGRTIGTTGDTGNFGIGISKYTATGAQFQIYNGNRYNVGGNSNAPSSWTSYIQGTFRQPLLQGNGIQFNRIAGPNGQIGSYGGVAIARLNTDTSLNDFEMATRNLVADVEKAYWNLYYAYHRLESVRSGRDAAYQTWLQTKTHSDVGSRAGRSQYLAQAEHNYFTFRQQTEVAQSNLFTAENALRYIIGLTATDGRLIRPVDNPITAPIKLDWNSIVCEALLRSPELRKQKWVIKQRELELTASKNFLLPRLDLEGGYTFSGAGKDLLDPEDRRSNAYGSLTTGDYQGWTLGLSASMPFGWRRELAGVRNAQLNVAKAKAVLQEQELELTHQLADSFRTIDLAYQQMQTTLAGRRSATDEVNAVAAAFQAGTITLDQLLDAQRRQAEAETDYYSSVVDYNLAIMTLHYRKGSLLEYDNVCLTEGSWPAKAYFDAKRRARERDAAHYMNYGLTRPRVVSRGTYQQFQNGDQYDYNSPAADELPMPMPMNNPKPGVEIPPAPTLAPKVLETGSSSSPVIPIPVPVLQSSGMNKPVSFIQPEVPSAPALTPARNMRYIQK
ncbi:MAG: TolC family protein [Planctomycetaceae bacterium]|nr:TolC family protein [Planctomycetaceae bacterium]